ncbi:MAG: WecB/TagA/CpsF family glycosyltransferase [Flavobacteriales bacterium]|nr:WecB/TagA/CpsF family glycosyltransferase [Flavobacteriales bacterium]
MTVIARTERLGMRLSLGTFRDHIAAFVEWGAAHHSSYVCCVNAHMTVEAHQRHEFMEVVCNADAATPDGMPVLRYMQRTGHPEQERVAGNDILPALLEESAARGLSVYLYGGRQEVLDAMVARIRRDLPALRVAGTLSPPFRPLTTIELAEHAQAINRSGAHVVMVSLGCPKQERWMAAMKGQVHAVMLGLGGAFLLYAGMDTRAPKWMRDLSLEWCYRLWLEPRRLWKRYLVTNSHFVFLAIKHYYNDRRGT